MKSISNEAYMTTIPVMGICGWSGAGKTTLILAITAHFREKGLRVGVIKHDVHGLQLDREGKDSYRFFESGADVIMRSPTELLVRAHRTGEVELDSVLREVAPYYDLLLVEGHKSTPTIEKLWVLAEGETECPPEVSNVIASLPRGDQRTPDAITLVDRWLNDRWKQSPVWAAVLLEDRYPGAVADRRKRLAQMGSMLASFTMDVVAVGTADIGLPLVLAGALSPVPDRQGWQASALAAMRWMPHVSWLLVAEGLDADARESSRLLLQARAPGRWIVGATDTFRTGQSLQALYCDYRSRSLIEGQPDLAEIGRWSVTRQM